MNKINPKPTPSPTPSPTPIINHDKCKYLCVKNNGPKACAIGYNDGSTSRTSYDECNTISYCPTNCENCNTGNDHNMCPR